jgi:hypothetical protein
MMPKTRPMLFYWLLLGLLLLLVGCQEAQDLANQTEVEELSQLEQAEFYGALQQTVALIQAPVLFVGLITLLGGWKLGRFGLALNGFVVGCLVLYTLLKTTEQITLEDETTLRALAIVGGVVAAIAAFYLYNLMSLVIGGAIGTTLLSGTWLNVLDAVPPQLLVFVTTFISAMLMFLIFRLFLVGFSALIGAVLLMLAAPFTAIWVLPIAALGVLIQSGIAWWLDDDIFHNLRGDMRQAAGQAFGEVLGPFSTLREKQREVISQLPQAAPLPAYSPFAPKRQAQPPVGAQQPYAQPSAPPVRAHSHAPYQPAPVYHQAPPVLGAQQSTPNVSPQPYPQQAQPPIGAHYSAPPVPPAPPAPVYQAPPSVAPAMPPAVPAIPTQPALTTQPPMEKTQPSLSLKTPSMALSDGRVIALTSSQVKVGRSQDCQIVVDDPQVSSQHLILSVHSEGVTVLDNQSTNGTLLNGQRLQGPHRLTPQDVIQIGNVMLRLVVD